MALSGTYTRLASTKSNDWRFPSGFAKTSRSRNSTTFTSRSGTDKSLVLYSPAGFLIDWPAKSPSNLRIAPKSGITNDCSIPGAERAELDAQGRIRIPERLVEFAGLFNARTWYWSGPTTMPKSGTPPRGKPSLKGIVTGFDEMATVGIFNSVWHFNSGDSNSVDSTLSIQIRRFARGTGQREKLLREHELHLDWHHDH